MRFAPVAERLLSLVDQADDPLGIVQQLVAGSGQGDALAPAVEKGGAETLLKLPDAGGDVGLDVMQFFGGPRNAPPVGDGSEDS